MRDDIGHGFDAAADREEENDDDNDDILSVDTSSTNSLCLAVGVKGERVKVLSPERTSHALLNTESTGAVTCLLYTSPSPRDS